MTATNIPEDTASGATTNVRPATTLVPEAWLTSARSGGAPEPTRARWQPLRVGIANLWEYDDAEFWFADGRLVLRGGNGTGKTKILELTTLMLLRGEIGPPVLDPFGSKHRTMRYNLLPSGEDDDPRPPADAGLGYAWAEFGRLDDAGDPHYLVCGLGASARRGSGTESPKRWMFVTRRRVGPDLVLMPPTGPIDERELRKLDSVHVFDNAERYRAELARELFGLQVGAFDNLTELLKQLRRPKLGERLNPKELERTLREALPELAAGEVVQLVEGWDRLEELRAGVEHLEDAAKRVATFVRRGWTPWVRLVVRLRADEVASATTQLDNTTRARRKADEDLAAARTKREETEELRGIARTELTDSRTRLRELMESRAYRDAVSAAQRAESLVKEARREHQLAGEAKRIVAAETEKLGKAAQALEQAESGVATADQEVTGRAHAVQREADTAGLGPAAEAHLPSRAIDALRAQHGSRVKRLDHLEELHQEWEAARRLADSLAEAHRGRQQDEELARTMLGSAEDEAAERVENLEAHLESWASGLDVAPVPTDLLTEWREIVAELATPRDERARSLSEALGMHLATAERGLLDQREGLRLDRRPLAERKGTVEAELTKVREQTDESPPAPVTWARRDRVDAGAGAPFWRCVRPRDDVAEDSMTRVEAALAAAGLLDAWITPDGQVITQETDTFAIAGAPAPGPTLADVLEATADGGVSTERIAEVLAGIGWHPARPADDGDGQVWLAADGSWRVAVLTGRAEPSQPASYLGATAREQARQRRIVALEAELAALSADIEALDVWLAEVDASLSAVGDARKAIPRDLEHAVRTAIAEVGAASRAHGAAVQAVTDASRRHGKAEKERDQARAVASEYAAEHGFPLDGLSDVRRALGACLHELERLEGALNVLRARQDHAEGLAGAHEDAAESLARAERKHGEAVELARTAEIAARTAQEAIDTDAQTQLRSRDDLDAAIKRLERDADDLQQAVSDLRVKEANAEKVLGDHERGRADAEHRREETVAAWWRAVDEGLVDALGLDVPQSRAIEPTLDAVRTVRRTVSPPERADLDRAWRRCFEDLQDLRQILIPTRDVHVREDEDAGDLPRVEVLVDTVNGWMRPDGAAALLADQVRMQRDRFDAEQQRVLTRLLGSTFIEHLKERLDYTESVFRRINECLRDHPTRQGHTLRLAWDATSDDATAGQVVEALRQGYEHLAEDRQEMVRAFLKRRIEHAREDAAAQGVADWQEHLADALDYRRWLRVNLEFRPGPRATWRPFDAARHGSKSGGEKVVLLSQPLFAAAVVAYDAAGPIAPRMVWLDEAMTGIDGEVKASFMGLTVELDLDVMLTAHDEWCRYASVPAAAVYDLSRIKSIAGVDAMPYLWCGRTWTQLDSTLAARAQPVPDAEDVGGLF